MILGLWRISGHAWDMIMTALLDRVQPYHYPALGPAHLAALCASPILLEILMVIVKVFNPDLNAEVMRTVIRPSHYRDIALLSPASIQGQMYRELYT